MSIKVGTRVEVDSPATGPQTGCGARGVVESTTENSSSVTGVKLRWTSVNVRMDDGSLLTREPRQLRVCGA